MFYPQRSKKYDTQEKYDALILRIQNYLNSGLSFQQLMTSDFDLLCKEDILDLTKFVLFDIVGSKQNFILDRLDVFLGYDEFLFDFLNVSLSARNFSFIQDEKLQSIFSQRSFNIVEFARIIADRFPEDNNFAMIADFFDGKSQELELSIEYNRNLLQQDLLSKKSDLDDVDILDHVKEQEEHDSILSSDEIDLSFEKDVDDSSDVVVKEDYRFVKMREYLDKETKLEDLEKLEPEFLGDFVEFMEMLKEDVKNSDLKSLEEHLEIFDNRSDYLSKILQHRFYDDVKHQDSYTLIHIASEDIEKLLKEIRKKVKASTKNEKPKNDSNKLIQEKLQKQNKEKEEITRKRLENQEKNRKRAEDRAKQKQEEKDLEYKKEIQRKERQIRRQQEKNEQERFKQALKNEHEKAEFNLLRDEEFKNLRKFINEVISINSSTVIFDKDSSETDLHKMFLNLISFYSRMKLLFEASRERKKPIFDNTIVISDFKGLISSITEAFSNMSKELEKESFPQEGKGSWFEKFEIGDQEKYQIFLYDLLKFTMYYLFLVKKENSELDVHKKLNTDEKLETDESLDRFYQLITDFLFLGSNVSNYLADFQLKSKEFLDNSTEFSIPKDFKSQYWSYYSYIIACLSEKIHDSLPHDQRRSFIVDGILNLYRYGGKDEFLKEREGIFHHLSGLLYIAEFGSDINSSSMGSAKEFNSELFFKLDNIKTSTEQQDLEKQDFISAIYHELFLFYLKYFGKDIREFSDEYIRRYCEYFKEVRSESDFDSDSVEESDLVFNIKKYFLVSLQTDLHKKIDSESDAKDVKEESVKEASQAFVDFFLLYFDDFKEDVIFFDKAKEFIVHNYKISPIVNEYDLFKEIIDKNNSLEASKIDGDFSRKIIEAKKFFQYLGQDLKGDDPKEYDEVLAAIKQTQYADSKFRIFDSYFKKVFETAGEDQELKQKIFNNFIFRFFKPNDSDLLASYDFFSLLSMQFNKYDEYWSSFSKFFSKMLDCLSPIGSGAIDDNPFLSLLSVPQNSSDGVLDSINISDFAKKVASFKEDLFMGNGSEFYSENLIIENMVVFTTIFISFVRGLEQQTDLVRNQIITIRDAIFTEEVLSKMQDNGFIAKLIENQVKSNKIKQQNVDDFYRDCRQNNAKDQSGVTTSPTVSAESCSNLSQLSRSSSGYVKK